MQLFKHSLYELSKGVRGLVLLTDEIDKTDKMVERLESTTTKQTSISVSRNASISSKNSTQKNSTNSQKSRILSSEQCSDTISATSAKDI